MCNTDTGVLGQVWYNKGAPVAFPDFKTEHKCKNYDAVREWAEKHQVGYLLPYARVDRDLRDA